MFKLFTQPHSDIPASTQLVTQIAYAIACGRYALGYRLTSTRQLALQTGLHRNTIAKVYGQLEEMGLVQTRAGSGIYVRQQALQVVLGDAALKAESYQLVGQGIDRLLEAGYNLQQVRALFLSEIDWRLRSSARLLVCVPRRDLGAGDLMMRQLQQAFGILVELVPLDELEPLLSQNRDGTVVTMRYFTSQVEAITTPLGVRLLPVDIYDYKAEIDRIRLLPPESCLGLVSISSAILGVSEVFIHSMRSDLLVLSSTLSDEERLMALVRRAQTIICDPASLSTVRLAVRTARSDLIRPPEVVEAGHHISAQSLALLRRELGLGS